MTVTKTETDSQIQSANEQLQRGGGGSHKSRRVRGTTIRLTEIESERAVTAGREEGQSQKQESKRYNYSV